MSAAKKLSDDMDLIKEFESLKLKQGLLLESLKHKHKQEENDKEIKEVHSIVQQLLDVFLEAKEDKTKNKSDDESDANEENETPKEDPLTRIESKIDALQKDVSELQSKMNSNNSTLYNASSNTTSNSTSEPSNNISDKLDVFNKSKGVKEEKDKNSNQSSNSSVPPIPKSWGTQTKDGDNKL